MKNLHVIVLALAGLIATFAPAGAADPEFVYETSVPGYYLGRGQATAVDAAGAAFVAGAYYLNGYSLDIIVMKFSPLGDLEWSRSIDGASHDHVAAIAVAASGDLWLTGWTDSADYPLVNPMDGTLTGFRDIILTRLSGDDGSIEYSTLIGGDYTDEAADIAFGPGGEIVLAGSTISSDFPVTADAVQSALNSYPYASSDAFVLRLNAQGDEILYASYLGGSDDDGAKAVTVDASGRIAIAGDTDSNDFPLASAMQPSTGGAGDAFVARLSADGASLDFATYLGGAKPDGAFGLAVDASGALVVAGGTQSTDFPTTAGAYLESFVGAVAGCGGGGFGNPIFNCPDAWIARLAPAGDALDWSTYLGGSEPDYMRDMVLDAQGRPLLVGYTQSPDFPLADMDSSAEIVVSRLGADGATLEFTVSVNSPAPGAGHGIALGPDGDIYFTGAVEIPYEIYVARLGGDGLLTAVPGGAVSPARLDAAHPNPFNPSTKISFALDEPSEHELAIFDLSGRRLHVLSRGHLPAGAHQATWDGRDDAGRALAGGVYLALLSTPTHSESIKLTLLK